MSVHETGPSLAHFYLGLDQLRCLLKCDPRLLMRFKPELYEAWYKRIKSKGLVLFYLPHYIFFWTGALLLYVFVAIQFCSQVACFLQGRASVILDQCMVLRPRTDQLRVNITLNETHTHTLQQRNF